MRRTRVLLALLVTATLGVGHGARAHGGDEHGAAARPSATSAGSMTARVPIEAQFLAGLRTQRVKHGVIASSVGRTGLVIGRPTGDLVVTAPGVGRLLPPEGGLVHLGEEVKKGQLLGTLHPTLDGADTAQLSLARSDASARATAAAARLVLAERELARRQSLQGIVAAKEVQAAETEVEVARSEVARARRDAGSLSGSVGAQQLRSSIDGTVVSSRATPGAQVADGTELWRIVDLSTLWVDVRIAEADAARAIPDRAEMALVTDPTVRIEAKRVATASLVDPATRTVQALFEFDNRDRKVRVGALLDVVMSAPGGPLQVIIPATALLDRNGQPSVVVKTGAETFEVRSVAVGPSAAGQIGITGGLAARERVVVEGAMAVLMAVGD